MYLKNLYLVRETVILILSVWEQSGNFMHIFRSIISLRTKVLMNYCVNAFKVTQSRLLNFSTTDLEMFVPVTVNVYVNIRPLIL